MAPLSAISVSECDPYRPLLTKPLSNSSVSHQSSSIKPSMRSSRSRITLAGYDLELEPKLDVMYGTTNNAKEFGWFDHLLGVFCIYRRPKIANTRTASERPPEYEDREAHLASPWVLPVYVLSTERDEHRHLMAREAKCTIDTGNLQGNIVSRHFLVDVLGYSESNFHKLTKEEEDGGTGITGHKLIPDGAVYLTWYHSNSTRVFRDMRFLISEHPMYDLIIGARSIKKHNILDVPNLASTAPPIIFLNDGPSSAELQQLQTAKNTAEKEWTQFRVDLKKLKAKATPERKKELDVELDDKKKKYENAKDAYDEELQDVYQRAVQQAKDEGDNEKAADLGRQYQQRSLKPLPAPSSGESSKPKKAHAFFSGKEKDKSHKE